MGHDWIASVNRIFRTIAGSKRIDKVPFLAFAGEQMICRITGKTVRELYSSPKTYSNAIITSFEFLNTDSINVPSAYAGPSEALAFAEANNKLNVIKWFDYQPLMVKQGAICQTEEDIDKLEIPDHGKNNLWKNSMLTAKMINEKINFPQVISLSIWSVVQELRGIEAYKDMRRNPELLLKLCEKIYESQMDIYENWLEIVGMPPNVFIAGYSFNKHMMSFQDAMKYEGQFIKRMQKKIEVPFMLHNCGTSPYINEVFKEIDFIAINGSHPLDIEFWIDFKKRYPKVTIIGANIDVSREMLTGTPSDVEAKVKENILNLAPGGRYICCPVCSLPWGVSIPNILAIPNAIEKYGHYPINIQD
jgi:uroporphyrinogen-III decarboxylase